MCGCGGSSWRGMNYAPAASSGAWANPAAPSKGEWEVRIPLRRKVDGAWVQIASPTGEVDPNKTYQRFLADTYQEAEALLRKHGAGGAIARVQRAS